VSSLFSGPHPTGSSRYPRLYGESAIVSNERGSRGIARDRGGSFRFIRILIVETSRNSSSAVLQARSKLSVGAHRAGNVTPRGWHERNITGEILISLLKFDTPR